MNIPADYHFVKWLKGETVALILDQQGRRLVAKEVANAKILSQLSDAIFANTRVLRTIMPKLFQIGDNLLARQYIEGQQSGDTIDTFGLTDNSFNKIAPQILANSLFELSFISSASFLKPQAIERRGSIWYRNNIKETKEAIDAQFGENYFYAIDNYLRINQRQIDEASTCLLNGDLNPQNIFVNCLLGGEAKDFMISDWDLMQINNPGFDLADLYVWSWRNSSWRERLINEFMALWKEEQPKLTQCISYCQVYLSCQMIKHAKTEMAVSLSQEQQQNAEGLLNSSKELLRKILRQ